MTGLTDAGVPGVWQALGLPGLVDLHVHFMPDNVLAKVWAYFDRAGDGLGYAWPIHYREQEDARLARLQALGVTAFPSLLYPHKPGMAAWLNAWAGQFADRHPQVLRTATFFPEPGVAAEVERALTAGTRVFKAHLQVGGYDPRDPLLDPVWGLLSDAATPVVVHCGSGPEPGRFTGPGPFGEVLARHPRLVAVIAHLGMPEYEPFLEIARRYLRVRLDTTMAFTRFVEEKMPFPSSAVPLLAELADRIVLGSDFPNTPYPYAEQVAGLLRVAEHPALGERWLRGVLHDNGAALIAGPV